MKSGNIVERIEGPTYRGSSAPVKIDVTSMTVVDNYVWTGSTEGIIRLWDANTRTCHVIASKKLLLEIFF
jgi:WD40 repeat protein